MAKFFNLIYNNLLLVIVLIPSPICSQWVQQVSPANLSLLRCISFNDSQNGVAGGWELVNDTSKIGRAIYTTNGGLNWYNAVVPNSLNSLNSIIYFDQQNAYGIGTCNPSSNYKTIIITEDKNIDMDLRKAIRDNNFFMGAMNSTCSFLKTSNGGLSWENYGTIPANIIFIFGACFLDMTTGFALANTYWDLDSSRTGIIKTLDGGFNWNIVSSPDSADELYGVDFVNDNTGFTIGFNRIYNSHYIVQGLIMRTTDAGLNWNKQLFYWVNNFTSVSFANETTGFACGVANSDSIGKAVIYKTTNSGVNWFLLQFGMDTTLWHGINFPSAAGDGFVYGEKFDRFIHSDNVISRTTDYGESWYTFEFADSTHMLVGNCALDQNNWYISGGDIYNGYILHTTNGGGPIGIENISQNIPSKFSLLQNFPNPFNPSTTIKFDLPKDASVTIQIFDMLGRVVDVLAKNELKRAGSYQVDWNASNYSSGVFFYRLEAGDYVSTKKMILIK